MSYLKRIIYNCKQATYLIDKKALHKLTLRETFELRIHLYGCGFCRLYKKQAQAINDMVQALFRSVTQTATLDDDYKNDLRQRMEEEINK
jgi:hypothetical protein